MPHKPKAPPGGGTGRGLDVRGPLRLAGQFVQMGPCAYSTT